MKWLKNLCALLAAATLIIAPTIPATAAMQYGTAVKNARLDAVESTIGTSAVLKIYTGSMPANCAAAATGTVLATMSLPSDWMGAASAGVKSLSGTWSDSSADASGTAGYFRILDSTATTCGIQGTVTATGGGGDLTLDNTSIASAQLVQINSFSLTAGN